MKAPSSFELPDHLKPEFSKAKKLEWITLVYLITVVVVMYLVMGSSQAMKTAWLEDLLSLVPSIAFLITSRIYHKSPNEDFPYGYHRCFGIAYFAGAISLFFMGAFLAFDSTLTLIKAEHPTIGSIQIMGQQVWMGWIMILALLYSAIPAMIIGHIKLPVAEALHNKILYTDAEAQKADYMTALAAILGILGIGAGFWWADATAALFISLSVLRDGAGNLSNAVRDLTDRYPIHIKSKRKDELVKEIESEVKTWHWVTDARVRFREQGQVYFGEVFVIPTESESITQRVEEGVIQLKKFHWKIHDIVITPVQKLPIW